MARHITKRSTGPKTPAGKAASSRNAVTHGLLSRDTVLSGERPEDLAQLRQAYLDEFQPATPAEEFLVRQLSSADWRLQRLERVETCLFEALIEQVEGGRATRAALINAPDDPEPETEAEQFDLDTGTLGRAFLRDCKSAASLAILSRYESSIRRSYRKAPASGPRHRKEERRPPFPPPGWPSRKLALFRSFPRLPQIRPPPRPPCPSPRPQAPGP